MAVALPMRSVWAWISSGVYISRSGVPSLTTSPGLARTPSHRTAVGAKTGLRRSSLLANFPVANFSARKFRAVTGVSLICVCCVVLRLTVGTGAVVDPAGGAGVNSGTLVPWAEPGASARRSCGTHQNAPAASSPPSTIQPKFRTILRDPCAGVWAVAGVVGVAWMVVAASCTPSGAMTGSMVLLSLLLIEAIPLTLARYGRSLL